MISPVGAAWRPTLWALFLGASSLAACGRAPISGTVAGRDVSFVSAAFVTVAADANGLASGVVTQIYLTNRADACRDLTSGILRSGQESLFLSAYDAKQAANTTAPTEGAYALLSTDEAAQDASGEKGKVAQGQLLVIDNNCVGSATSAVDVTTGSLSLSRYVLASSLHIALDLHLGTGHIEGPITAEWCPAVASLFTDEAANAGDFLCAP